MIYKKPSHSTNLLCDCLNYNHLFSPPHFTNSSVRLNLILSLISHYGIHYTHQNSMTHVFLKHF